MASVNALAFAICGFFLASVSGALSFWSFGDALVVSRFGRPASSALETAIRGDFALVPAGLAACAEGLKSAAVTDSLRRLRRVNQARDYDSWFASLQRARASIRDGLRCSPSNGTAWAWAALLERAAADDAASIGPLLEFSQRLAPAEIGDLSIRLRLAKASATLPVGPTDPVGRDLRLLLEQGRPRDIARLLNGAVGPLDEAARAVVRSLRPEQRASTIQDGLFAEQQAPAEWSFWELIERPHGAAR